MISYSFQFVYTRYKTMLKLVFLVLLVFNISGYLLSFRGRSIDDAPINTILRDYNKYARASTDDTPVNVTYSMSLRRIVGFDTKRLVVHAWIVMTWNDPRLEDLPLYAFLPLRYGHQISPITTSKYEPNAVVGRDGVVNHVPVTKLDTDDCKFVNDIIECKFKFGSRTYNGNELNIETMSKTVDMDDYISNDIYEIINSKVQRNITKYACCPEPYITFDYILHLKPKQQFQHWFPWS